MTVKVEMTPELAMKAVETMRDALSDIAAGTLPETCLLAIVQNEVWPHKPDADDIAWAKERVAQMQKDGTL